MTPKLDGFKALGVKHPKDLLTQVKKATKLNLAILSINPNFLPFDVNTQCLMRQEIWLLSEKFNSFSFFFIYLFLSISCQGHLSNKSSLHSKILKTNNRLCMSYLTNCVLMCLFKFKVKYVNSMCKGKCQDLDSLMK